MVRWSCARGCCCATEFLWQRAIPHADEAEAREKTAEMLEVYRWFSEEILAVP